jgi:Fur family ferric uptake transcriptional regulator
MGVSAGTRPVPITTTTLPSTIGSLTAWANYDRQVASESLAQVLRERGLRLTAQRQLVLEAVYALGHATPDQVHAAVARTAAGVNVSTVYRTLELLEELGLIRHTHLTHGAPTYHAATEDQHVHLVCRDCGAVDEVAPAVLDDLVSTLRAGRGFRVDVGHVALFGQCAGCLGSTP